MIHALALFTLAQLSVEPSSPQMQWLAAKGVSTSESVGLHPRVFGPWIVAGASIVDGEVSRGAVHLFRRNGNSYLHHQRLLAPTSDSKASDGYGSMMAINERWLAVADLAATTGDVASGAVHLYRLDDKLFKLHSTLTLESPRANAAFGAYLDLDSDTLMVGEAENFNLGGWGDNRQVHVFEFADDEWQRRPGIVRPEDLHADPAAAAKAREQGMERFAGFGAHFDLDADRLAVAAMGASAWLYYRRSAKGWQLEQRIDAGEHDIGYARTLSLDGDTAIVAALRGHGSVKDNGVAYAYKLDGDRWTREHTFALDRGQTLDMFGHWVAADEGTVVIGAHQRRRGDPEPRSGSAYAYRRGAAGWQFVAQLQPPNAADRRFTAYALDIHRGRVVLSPGSELPWAAQWLSEPTNGGVWAVDIAPNTSG